jgi:hypothetical protein
VELVVADVEIWKTPAWVAHTQALLNSYARWLREELVERSGDEVEDAKRLFFAEAIVVSHGIEADPVLNYGNDAALQLWEMDVAAFTSTPSRYTAEFVERAERERLLDRTTRDGFVDDYQGVRITDSGKRFHIHQAIVWNLLDNENQPIGQAATFSDWEWVM